jgi:hypothetical protein
MAFSVHVQLKLRKLNDLRKQYRMEFDGLPEDQARIAAEALKRGIYGQRYGHHPLARSYRTWKRKHGLDSRILIATGEYVRSITAYRQNATTWIAGPLPGTTTTGGFAMTTLALWLEYGTRHMPARPHYRIEVAAARERMRQQGAIRIQRLAKNVVSGSTQTVG